MRQSISLIIILFLASISTSLFANDYYWIGGSGNWSDLNHWSETSGGSILHITVPGPLDNVIFDDNSFPDGGTATILAENATCHDFKSLATTNPFTISMPGNTLRIFGSLIFTQMVTNEIHGAIEFRAEELAVIKTRDIDMWSDIFFLGEAGEWTFQSDFTTTGAIYLQYGSITTNNHSISCANFISTNSHVRTLILGTSTLNVSGSWEISSKNITIEADQSTLIAGTTITTNDGPEVFYHNAFVTNPMGLVSHNNSKGHYNSIHFLQPAGTLFGKCTSDSCIFSGKGFITDIDTIGFAHISGIGRITGTENANRINNLHIDSIAEIRGNNTIDSSFLRNNCKIQGTNRMHFVEIKGQAYITGENFGHYVLLNKEGVFDKTNTFDTLIFQKGREYSFIHNSTQTINNYLEITGDCNNPITMKSDTNGYTANIIVPVTTMGSNISARDIHVTQGKITASESIDLGNNTGWEIQQSVSRTLYWVNGPGNWNDSSHWSFTLNGAGGECPPTEIDDIYFASADKVLINVPNAVCHNLDCNTHAFSGELNAGDTSKLNIYGSLFLSPQMNLSTMGGIFFESENKNESILNNGISFPARVKFNGIDGGWNMQDKFECNDTLFLIYGDINAMNNNIKTAFFNSNTKFERGLDISNSTFSLSGGGESWLLNDENFTLKAPLSHIIIENSSSFRNIGSQRLLFHNLTAKMADDVCYSEGPYSVFNKIICFAPQSGLKGSFKADSALFYGSKSFIEGAVDTIRAAIFYADKNEFSGNHNVSQYSEFYGEGLVSGINKIDTVLIHSKGIVENFNTIDTLYVGNKATINGINNIGSAVLKGNGFINGENEFHDLYFTPKKEYYFEGDSTQKITGNLFCSGYCSSYILIHSDSTGSQANVNMTAEDITGNYLILRDINMIGLGNFIAENSVDMGNNQGWEIQPAVGEAKYWVEGNGVWSDSTHWANTSGGQGGVCMPSAYDDVFFDNNSFESVDDTVAIDVRTTFCRNMTWDIPALHPTFHSADTNRLIIHGSLELCDSMLLDLFCPVWFKTVLRGNTINTLDHIFKNHVYFTGETGMWEILSKFKSLDTIFLESGNLHFKDSLFCNQFSSITQNPRTLNITNQGAICDSWDINAKNLTLMADGSHIVATHSVSTKEGDKIQYHHISFSGTPAVLTSNNISSLYKNVKFEFSGSVKGNGVIDSLLVNNVGTLLGNDTISYLSFNGGGSIISDKSIINSALMLRENATISGENQIDTCLLYCNTTIENSNTIDTCYIDGTAMIIGTNTFSKALIIEKDAFIYDQNLFSYAWLKGDGTIGGANVFRHLVFSPGMTYKLEQTDTQTIEETFDIRGNNCFPITFLSTTPGVTSNVNMPDGKIVSGDYIEMRDIHATGGATFYAGGHSTNHSNNDGWDFENAPGYIYGLMPDTSICPGTTLVINTDSFNGDDSTRYTWNNGTTDPIYTTDQSGPVIVNVQYANNCTVTDTINVTVFPKYEFIIETDSDVCAGDTISATTNIPDPIYNWPNGSNEPYYIADYGGEITAYAIDENNCPVGDTATINVKPLPYVYLGDDIILEEGSFITLDAGNSGCEFIWSTGAITQQIEVCEESQYWVTVTDDGCAAMDTIFIGEYIIGIPTGFSPNGDGENEEIGIMGTGFDLEDFVIVNRQGEIVFRTKNPNEKWDGTYNGKPQDIGVYMYMIKFSTKSSPVRIQKGNITLLR